MYQRAFQMTIIRFIHMQSIFKFAKFYSFIVKIFRFMACVVTRFAFMFSVEENDTFTPKARSTISSIRIERLTGVFACRFSNFPQLDLKRAYN